MEVGPRREAANRVEAAGSLEVSWRSSNDSTVPLGGEPGATALHPRPSSGTPRPPLSTAWATRTAATTSATCSPGSNAGGGVKPNCGNTSSDSVPPASAALHAAAALSCAGDLVAPAGGRVLPELEGPVITTFQAPGLDLYRSGEPGRLQFIVVGSIWVGPLVRFRVPDRAGLPLYRVRVLQVTGEGYGLRDPTEYWALVITS